MSAQHSTVGASDDQVARGAIAIISDSHGRLLLHLRDDVEGIAWPGYWSVLGGGCDPGECPDQAIVRELDEEAGLSPQRLRLLFQVPDVHGSGQLLSVYSGFWDGDETALPLAEGVRLQFFDPDHLDPLRIPPHVRDAITRYTRLPPE
jgi:8-oxo-dGTP diphosphatase